MKMALVHPWYWKIVSVLWLLIQREVSALEDYGNLKQVVLREINLNKSPLNQSLWSNEGYQESSAAQISHRIDGMKLKNVSARFLMATGDAKLHTTLPDFSGRFLSIKFSSMIGKSVLATKKTTTSTTTPTTTTTTAKTTISSTLISTTRTTITTASPEQTTQKTVLPSAVVQLQAPQQSLQPGQIIEITLENGGIQEIESAPIPKSVMSTRRKRRELNSQEISQVNKIVAEATDTKTGDKKRNAEKLPAINVIAAPAVQAIAIPILNVGKSVVPPAPISSIVLDPNLQYKTWKASLSQSFRPSGFYVLVDDYVVYDNWEGVWSLNKPNVLGKHVKNSVSDIWSHTEILLEWEKSPEKDVKVRFEWNPPAPSSFLFLGDTIVSTIAAETPQLHYASETLNNKNITLYIVLKQQEVVQAQTIPPAVKNIESPVTIPTTTTSTPSTTKATTTATTSSTSSTTTTRILTTTNKPATASIDPSDVLQRIVMAATADENKNAGRDHTTSFLVVSVLGVVCFFIMVVLIHIKFKENQRLRGSYC